MKTLLIAFFALSTFISIQDTETIYATFDGMENEVYYFSDEADTTHVFDAIADEAAKKFDLTNERFNGKTFKITYSTETIMDEMDDQIEVLTIENLEILSK
ncbi:hypothetical protein KO494_03410 [Lacinutrix sp. C3R15]|uniref:hypothetical protein n=1 Tax=Flavobacteriaceae TaxID=49546 RepID=UPI001C08921B|nr:MULTISPECIES: hypothetical protein [Flavobacteriaceae]MBU2938580.1 hypothetical protein [Lacinutrix sp. C3R15]MDO6621894.1 hypothetical protein [Oceanihabitans sp. 1_MG-2023]